MAAENAAAGSPPRPDARASMRPRRMAAENLRALGVETEGAVASMRPRRMAAENIGICATARFLVELQ